MKEERLRIAESKPEEALVLRWDEGPYAGMRVTCRPLSAVSLGLTLALSRPAPTTELQAARHERFGKEVLLDWNLDDRHDKPLPADGEGMLYLTSDHGWAIVRRWIDEVTQPAAPLGDSSSSGGTSSSQS